MDLQEAIAQHKAGRLEEAEAMCRKLLVVSPDDARVRHLLALIAHQGSRNEEAIKLARRAIELAPNQPEFQITLGIFFGRMGRHDKAATLLTEVVARHPRSHWAQHNLGVALEHCGRLPEAADAYRQAVALKSDYATAHHHLATVLRKLGLIEEAIAADRAAIAVSPTYADAYRGLASAYTEIGRQDDVIASRRQVSRLEPDNPTAHSDLLYSLHYSPRSSPSDRRDEAEQWARVHTREIAKLPPPPNSLDPDRSLRIGYLSPDFRTNVVAQFLEPIIQSHDHKFFEVFCYSAVEKPDEVTERFRSLTDHWRDVAAVSDDEVARQIRGDRIDVLVELAGHMRGSRLAVLARRPAPLQLQMGYTGTTGLPEVDYRITDEQSDPPGAQAYYTEKLLRLPVCAFPYKPANPSPAVGPLPLTVNGYVTFGCLNNRIKVTEEAVLLWASIMREIPRSRLTLHWPPRDRALADLFGRHGISAHSLLLMPRIPHDQYLRVMTTVDIALDTFPYNGDTTTLDGLWMGVPLITLSGDAFVSRRGASHLNAVGLPNLMASSPDEYVRIAVDLARRPQQLQSLRATLRERMRTSPLCDWPQYTRHFERAIRQIWCEWCHSCGHVH